ncbi:uncharacterized protein LOC134773419 [Penaeus indicus]|uniref:uncharacterized protein LOC134773419 n=1 Tax=Penaeus indicus TaxID=29960 RepID=UPI00300CE1EB
MVTPDRLVDVDMSEFLYLDEVSAGYKKPVFESDINGFLKPFTPLSWALILATLLGVLTAACGVRVAYARVSQRRRREKSTFPTVALHLANRTPPITDEAMLWTVGAILAQSISKVPRGDSVRVITGLWLLASLILTTVYRSNLKAMLILPKLNLPFDNLEQLVETDLPVWMSSSTTIYQAIQSAPPDTSLGRLLPQVYHKDPVLSIERLVGGHHVLLVPRSALLQILHQTFSTTGQCKNYIMSESFMKTTTLRLIFPKGSSLKGRVDPIIWRMREAGILDHIFMKAVYNASECMKHDVSQPNNSLRTLELGDFYGVFIVYARGTSPRDSEMLEGYRFPNRFSSKGFLGVVSGHGARLLLLLCFSESQMKALSAASEKWID